MASANLSQKNLGLTSDRWSTTSEWSRVPDLQEIETLARSVLNIVPSRSFKVAFLAKGSYNKAYSIALGSQQGEYVLRITLPVDPVHKTTSEVATLRFLERGSSLPVPRVVAYGVDRGDIGYEWMLMTRMPGEQLYRRWRTISMEAKKRIIDQMAVYLAELFRLRFKGDRWLG